MALLLRRQCVEVDQDGVVFEKDLGTNTASLFRKLETYNPDSSWTAIYEADEP